MSKNYKLEDADVGEVIVLADAAISAGFVEIKIDSQHALEIAKLAYESFELRKKARELEKITDTMSCIISNYINPDDVEELAHFGNVDLDSASLVIKLINEGSK